MRAYDRAGALSAYRSDHVGTYDPRVRDKVKFKFYKNPVQDGSWSSSIKSRFDRKKMEEREGYLFLAPPESHSGLEGVWRLQWDGGGWTARNKHVRTFDGTIQVMTLDDEFVSLRLERPTKGFLPYKTLDIYFKVSEIAKILSAELEMLLRAWTDSTRFHDITYEARNVYGVSKTIVIYYTMNEKKYVYFQHEENHDQVYVKIDHGQLLDEVNAIIGKVHSP